MKEKAKAPHFRGHVRKLVSPLGITSWTSEVRTTAVFTDLGQAHSVNEAIALAIQTANAPAPGAQSLSQAA